MADGDTKVYSHPIPAAVGDLCLVNHAAIDNASDLLSFATGALGNDTNRIVSAILNFETKNTAGGITEHVECPAMVLLDRNSSDSSKYSASIVYFKSGSWQTTTALSATTYLTVSYIQGYRSFNSIVADSASTSTPITTISTTCCFARDTLITMADGSKRQIQDIRIGDRVLSYDITDGKDCLARVSSIAIKTSKTPKATVAFSDGSSVEMASYHPLYTKQGWHSLTCCDGYGCLMIGDEVKTMRGWKTVVSIEQHIAEGFERYNLSIGDDCDELDCHNYYANDSLAHNIAIRRCVTTSEFSVVKA